MSGHSNDEIFHPAKELVSLAAQLTDSGLDDAESERLRELVAADLRNGVWFTDWMEVDAMLHLDFGNQDPTPLKPRPLLPQEAPETRADRPAASTQPSSTQPTSTQPTSTQPIAFSRQTPGSANGVFHPKAFLSSKMCLAIAASLLVGVSYLLGSRSASHSEVKTNDDIASAIGDQPTSQGEGPNTTIASIAGGVDAVFSDGLSLGSRLSPGIVRLEKGVAQVAFDRGAVLVLEGPAELELVDGSTCRLLSGSLSAEVLSEAAGFSVAAGGIKVTDRDAQFGMRMGPQNATEVHSFGSELQLLDFHGPSGQVRQLPAGQAIRWHPNHTATGIDPQPDSFITREKLAHRQLLNEQRAYARWVEYSRRWLHDPSVVLRYEFGPSATGEITNTVDASQHVAKSRQASPRWIPGRWAEKPAMLFDGRTDVLDTPDHPELRLKGSFTFAVWVRMRSFSHFGWTRIAGKGLGPDRNFGLWSDTRGDFLWQVCPDRDPESQEVWDRYSMFSDSCPVGEWLLVVGVVDGTESRLYVNGELHNSGPAPEDLATNDDPLTIGYYDDVPVHNEYFCGELDELILLNRALTEEEIGEMYEAGQPKYVPQPGELDESSRPAAQLEATI